MRMIKGVAAAVMALFLTTGCGKRPCESIPEPAHVKAMGIVMDGGKLCKDGKGVASVDYPAEEPPAVLDRYKKKLSGMGFDARDAGRKTIFARKDSKSFLIVSGTSKKRKVTFAIVKYCITDGCTKRITRLAELLSKKK